MGKKMKFLKDAVATAKLMPKAVLVAAVILPGGLTVIGIYLVAKSTIQTIRDKRKK
jgi:hypothetical protein